MIHLARGNELQNDKDSPLYNFVSGNQHFLSHFRERDSIGLYPLLGEVPTAILLLYSISHVPLRCV
jgi:hypothetical protein